MDLWSGPLMLVRDNSVEKGMMESPNLEKLARMFLIHDSLWKVNVLLESVVLGWTWEGTRGEDQFPLYVREGSSHESVVLG